MIPILYPMAATKSQMQNTNGLGALTDCIKCEVTEERNGIYELSMQYPLTGALFDSITEGAILKAKANDKSAPQLFRIYKSSAPLKGIVTYSAEHISYDLNGLPLPPLKIENKLAETALQRAFSACPLSHGFVAHSDITTLNNILISKPTPLRSALGGKEGGFLDVYGGEFEFDNFDVYLHLRRGENNGVVLRYGKNLTDLKQERNIANCYTHIYPYAVKTTTTTDESGNTTSSETVLTLSEGVLPLISAAEVGHTRALNLDLSSYFTAEMTFNEATLRSLAQSYIQTAELNAPAVNITLSFVNLAQTEDYKNIAPLETVGLCDTVNVYFEKLKVTAHAKVVKTVFDTLKEKYVKIEVGTVKSNFANTVKNVILSVENAKKEAAEGNAILTTQLLVESGRITAEVTRATTAESALQGGISANAQAIGDEAARAQSVETELSTKITQTAEAITSEVTRATTAESALQGGVSANAQAIGDEATRAQSVEETLSSQITQTAEAITSEVTRAKSAENTLSSQITQTATTITAKVEACAPKNGSSQNFAYSLTSTNFTLTANNKKVFVCDKNGVEISGKITATSGVIGGCVISEDGVLKITEANIEGEITASNIDITSPGGGKIKIGEYGTTLEIRTAESNTTEDVVQITPTQILFGRTRNGLGKMVMITYDGISGAGGSITWEKLTSLAG